MLEAVIFIGVQASGKSSFYKRYFLETHQHINLDTLHTRHQESLLLSHCLETKQSFVVDNTNPSRETRERYFELLRDKPYKIKGYYFQSCIEKCLQRNRQRAGKARVSERGVLSTYTQLELPKWDEGFDELYYVRLLGNGQFDIQEWKIEE